MRYQPQQLPQLSQPIRLQKSDYEQQKLESQLQQLLQLHRPQSLQKPAHPDSTQLLLHNQLYPHQAEVTSQPLHPNIDSKPLQNSQQKNPPQNSPKSQRRNSIHSLNEPHTDLSTQQNPHSQNSFQTNQHQLSLSYQHLHSQPVPQQGPLNSLINPHQVHTSGAQFNSQFAPINPPPTFSPLQTSNNSQTLQHLPKIAPTTAPNPPEVPKENFSSHLPPLAELSHPPHESALHANPQQFPFIPAPNQLNALQRHPPQITLPEMPQTTLPEISQKSLPEIPQKSLPTQRLHRVNTPYYLNNSLHDTDTAEDDLLLGYSSPHQASLLPQSPHYASTAHLHNTYALFTSSPTHADGSRKFPQPPDFLMHSAPPFKGTMPGSWISDTGKKGRRWGWRRE